MKLILTVLAILMMLSACGPEEPSAYHRNWTIHAWGPGGNHIQFWLDSYEIEVHEDGSRTLHGISNRGKVEVALIPAGWMINVTKETPGNAGTRVYLDDTHYYIITE